MKSHGLEIVPLPAADAKKFVDLTESKLWSKILEQSPENGARLKGLFEKAAG